MNNRNIEWELNHGFRHFGGSKTTITPADNKDMIKWMAARDDRNEELYAKRQADILKMEKERMAMESAQAQAIQKEEADILASAQKLEDAAQRESVAFAEEDDADTDNIITGFYGSLGMDRPA